MSIAKKEGPESKDTLKVSRSSAESKEEHPVESCRTSESLPPGAGAIELEKEEHNTVSTTVHGEQGTNADGSNANETPGPDGPGVPGQDEDAEKHEKIDLKMLLIILSLMLAVFCVALDNTVRHKTSFGTSAMAILTSTCRSSPLPSQRSLMSLSAWTTRSGT